MSLRLIAEPFVAAAPAGARVRTRLRVDETDAALLYEVGEFLGSLAGRDLAARCREGHLDAKGNSQSRKVRKQALTAESSSRWAGAITRTSEDQHRLAIQNMRAERASLAVRIRTITARLAAPVGGKACTGKRAVRGYPSKAERHSKTIRLQALTTRLAAVEADLAAGAVHVVRGGKALLHNRNNLAHAGLTPGQWRQRWDAERLFLTADGEKDKAWGNETIRCLGTVAANQSSPRIGPVSPVLGGSPIGDLGQGLLGVCQGLLGVGLTVLVGSEFGQVATQRIAKQF